MKHLRFLSAVLLVAVALAACGSPAAPITGPCQTKADGGFDCGGREIKIAVENAYNPFNFIDETTGQAVGYDYDLFADACKRINCKPVFVQTSWDAIVAVMGGTGQAEFDIAADGITITPERAQHVDFSTPYISLQQQLLVRADEGRFTDAESLKSVADFKVGAQPGTTNYDLSAEIFGEDRIVSFDQFGIIVQAIINGDIDGMLIDNVSGEGYMGANPNKLKLIGDPLSSEELGFVFPKGSVLLGPLNHALAAMDKDATLDRIYAQWFSKE